jgi:NADPH:quinone reductase
MKAIIVRELGGPEVLKLEEQPTPTPGPGEALVEIAAVGVNFVEIYHRTGMYKTQLPFCPGGEGAGRVVAAGPGVTEVSPGDRVAWGDGTGSYATHIAIPVERLAPLPDALTFEQGAAVILQGITAEVLTHETYRLKPNDTCLVHAAAGGAGLMLCQMAKMCGARVIGTVSGEEKAKLARDAGADEIIIYTEQDFEPAVRRLTGGRGVNVVYDSVGKVTFDRSLNCLAPLGYMVLFGQSSGFPPPFDIQRLAGMRSLFLTRPSIFGAYVTNRELLRRHAQVVFDGLVSGKLKVRIDRTYPLAQAAQAHIALASRQTSGKVLLIP